MKRYLLLCVIISYCRLLSLSQSKPNIILLMADDLGWGDVGYNANNKIRTPNVDNMASKGIVFERFYTSSSICSPTRGSCLTGRHPYRYGILAAHTAGMRVGEITIAEVLKDYGYSTGFFGKWHLGWIDPEEKGNRGFYSPPWHHGFDECFATTSAVPTWNPSVTPKGWNAWGETEGTPWKGGTPYVQNGNPVKDDMEGDDSKVMMDRVIPFIEKNSSTGTPFLAVVWFHTPHEPVVAGPEYLDIYKSLDSEKQRHYYGCITAMDEQIGRLREELRRLGIQENTVVFFTSDNGTADQAAKEGYGSTGLFRGHKHTMYEGGIRVPSLMEWPGHTSHRHVEFLCGTVDYFPTILELTGTEIKDNRPLDGISLVSVINGENLERSGFITAGFKRLNRGEDGITIIEHRYKLVRPPKSKEFELYDLQEDPSEQKNLAGELPSVVKEMKEKLKTWQNSVTLSGEGLDYAY